MKIEKLTDNKIRIILNIEELDEKNIDVHSLIKNIEETHRFFKKVLKQAQKEVNFKVDDSKLLIEAYISTEGFFVLTFTKITNPSQNLISNTSKPKAKRKNQNSPVSHAIYKFNTFEDFCNFCTYLNNSTLGNLNNLSKIISLYEYNFKYFLVLSEINEDVTDLSLFYILISEFAQHFSNSSNFVSKLNEYGNVIFENRAIKNGIKFFAKA